MRTLRLVVASVPAREVPQADNLENVRAVLEVVAEGEAAPRVLSERSGVSKRHVGYALHAARTLQLLEPDGPPALTPRGQALLAAEPGSLEERGRWRSAVLESPLLGELAPDLLFATPPDVATLSTRIQKLVPQMAKSTAQRRAQALLSWRAQLI